MWAGFTSNGVWDLVWRLRLDEGMMYDVDGTGGHWGYWLESGRYLLE